MTGKRSYGDACGVSRALDVIGERWALLVVRELLLGPKRFTDLRTSLPGVSPDVLAQRLRGLEEHGLVRKDRLPPPAAAQVYELTPKGFALEPVLIELGRWGGANAPPPCEGMCMSTEAHIVSLRTLFDPVRAEAFEGSFGLNLDGETFHATVARCEIEAGRGAPDAPDATIAGDAPTFLACLHGRMDTDEQLAAGALSISGDEDAARRFMTLFPLPEPAPV